MYRLKYMTICIMLFVLITPIVVAQDSNTIVDVVTASTEADEAEFTILLELVTEMDLDSTLADEDAEFTVFAPTDAAFEALLEEFELTMEDLLEAQDLVKDILLYHVAEGTISSEDLAELDTVATVQGGEIAVSVDEDDNIVLDEVAIVVDTDIEASNGVIHVIDKVLLPPEEGTVGAEACIVSTEASDTVRVRVGPGENRTSVSFLPANEEFTPLGQATDDDGNVWFQLDKEQAAPGRSINEAWVAAEELDTTGDCSVVGEAAAPPIISSATFIPCFQSAMPAGGARPVGMQAAREGG